MSNQVVYLVWRRSFQEQVSLVGVYSKEEYAQEVADKVYETSFNSWIEDVEVDKEPV